MVQVKVFVQPHYLQNFVQSTFNALGADKMKGTPYLLAFACSWFSLIWCDFKIEMHNLLFNKQILRWSDGQMDT